MRSAPRVPGVREATRLALVDLYHHSIRFVAVNLIWGLGLIVLLGVATAGAPWLALAASPLLALPLVGMARLANEVVRDRDVVLSDAWGAMRDHGLRAIGGGALLVAATVVLLANVLVGLATASPPAIALAVLAGWGLVGLGLVALPFWVLLADPTRTGGIVAAVREAGMLLLVGPARLLALTAVVAVVLIVGTVLVAAILTVGVAYAVLVTARIVVPAADRLAGLPGYASPND
jgi:hypothetical protein